MDNKTTYKSDTNNDESMSELDSSKIPEPVGIGNKDSELFVKTKEDSLVKNNLVKSESQTNIKKEVSTTTKKNLKPPKLEDKPFEEFIIKYFIPGLKSSIENTGTIVSKIKFIKGERPVVGGNCSMVFCEISEQRRFWLCFNKEIITSDKTILLAESYSEPSIVESFLIDEKKTTLPLLISRVLQRLNGQKWIGAN